MDRQPLYSTQFTWADLAVLGLSLALVLACVAPAIGTGRERGRSAVCSNNMRQIAVAMYEYESLQGEYLGYQNALTLNNGELLSDLNGQPESVSFVIPLLRCFDRPDLYAAWITPRAPGAVQSTAFRNVTLDALVCPSNSPPTNSEARLDYVANCGMEDWVGSATMPRDWEDNGVFFDRFTGDPRVVAKTTGQIPPGAIAITKMSSNFIAKHDGLVLTLMLSENVDAGKYTDTQEACLGFVWNGKGKLTPSTGKNFLIPPHFTPPNDCMRINQGIGMPNGKTMFARPSSRHPGGVNVAFCGVNQRFVSEKIDYYVYCLLMSTNGQNVREPGTNIVLPNFSGPFIDAWVY